MRRKFKLKFVDHEMAATLFLYLLSSLLPIVLKRSHLSVIGKKLFFARESVIGGQLFLANN